MNRSERQRGLNVVGHDYSESYLNKSSSNTILLEIRVLSVGVFVIVVNRWTYLYTSYGDQVEVFDIEIPEYVEHQARLSSDGQLLLIDDLDVQCEDTESNYTQILYAENILHDTRGDVCVLWHNAVII